MEQTVGRPKRARMAANFRRSTGNARHSGREILSMASIRPDNHAV
jgi:hypothetical protein